MYGWWVPVLGGDTARGGGWGGGSPRRPCTRTCPPHVHAARTWCPCTTRPHLGAADAAGSCQLCQRTRVTCGDGKIPLPEPKSHSRSLTCAGEERRWGGGGMGAAWGPPQEVALQRWQWGLLCSVGLCTELGAAWGGPAAGVEVGAGNGGPQCHPPRHCALDAGAAFSLNGKSGRNLGPFQSRRSRAPAAIRRQGKRWGERGGCGGALCCALCRIPLPTLVLSGEGGTST